MRVGIDIDGVLYPWDECSRDALVERFGIERPGPSLSWDFLQGQVTPEQWSWLWSAEGQDAAFGQVERTYPGVVEAVLAILRAPGFKVHFVTHRDPRRTACHTAAFLTRHFGRHPWAGVHVLQNGTPKHGLAEWDVFIDDKPQTVYEMLENTGALVLSPVRPWNEELALQSHRRFLRYRNPSTLPLLVGAS